MLYLFFTAYLLFANTKPAVDSLALLYSHIKNYKKGLETETQYDSTYFHLLQAKQLAIDMRLDSLLAEIKDSYAYFIKSRGQIVESLAIHHDNIQYALSKNDSFLLMRTYIAMGNNYFPLIEQSKKEIDSLIFYSQKGLRLAQLRKDILHTLIAKQNLAEHYRQRPLLKEKALSLLKETILLTDQHPEGIYFKAPAYRDIAHFYLEDKKYFKAIEALKKSIEFGETYESYGSLLMAYQDLQKTYETIGEYRESLTAYKKATFYREKLKDQTLEKEIAALEIAYEAERRQHRIDQLQLLNEKEKERSRRQRFLLITLLLGSFLVSFLVYLTFKNYKKKQQALLQLAANQEELANFKTRFYTNLTHEFRTPLTVIQGMTKRLFGNPDAKELILRNCQNLLDLVNQMLDLQKLDAGALKLQYTQSDIMAYLRFLVEPFIELAKEKAIHLTVYEECSSLQMDFDPVYFQQIVYNLLSNAIKFTPEKGEIILHATKLDQYLQLKVKDTGVGIDALHLDAIFDRFYQAPVTTQYQHVGTGIGLAFCKELVDLMGGSITVASTIKQGSTFTLLLPIQNNSPLSNVLPLSLPRFNIGDTKTTTTSLQSLQNIAVDAPTILLIEDHPDVLKLLTLTLQEQYQIITATNGQIGLTQAYTTIPDLIVSDIMMPEMDGVALCHQLKNDERSSHIPIILLTAKATKMDKLEGMKQGADAYITKPFDAQELLIRIDKLLENRRKLQSYYLQWNPFRKSDQLAPNKESAFLLKVKQIVEQQLADEQFGVTQLCKALCLSRMQVHRKLKAVCNKSTAQFIRELRLQKALHLLKTTDLTISEIAYSVGFADPNYFSKVFTDFYGYLPSVTRN